MRRVAPSRDGRLPRSSWVQGRGRRRRGRGARRPEAEDGQPRVGRKLSVARARQAYAVQPRGFGSQRPTNRSCLVDASSHGHGQFGSSERRLASFLHPGPTTIVPIPARRSLLGTLLSRPPSRQLHGDIRQGKTSARTPARSSLGNGGSLGTAIGNHARTVRCSLGPSAALVLAGMERVAHSRSRSTRCGLAGWCGQARKPLCEEQVSQEQKRFRSSCRDDCCDVLYHAHRPHPKNRCAALFVALCVAMPFTDSVDMRQ